MEKRDAVAEARAEAAERLRRERDLGHEDDRAATRGERGLARSDVDLGLAAAGRAGEEDVAAAAREQSLDPRERAFLRLGETGGRGLCGESRASQPLPAARHAASPAAAR